MQLDIHERVEAVKLINTLEVVEHELTFRESYLSDILYEFHRGEENAVTARQLRIHGFNPRELRHTVHDLRVKGYPICSGQNGYYYASNRREINSTMNFISSYIKNMKEAYAGLVKAYNTLDNDED